MSPSLPEILDSWLPDHTIRVASAQHAGVGVEELWAGASALPLAESPVLGRLIVWRIPGITREQTFDTLFRQPPFGVLASSPHALVSGLVGRIWTLRRDYPELDDPAAYRAWSQPGTARVLVAVWVEPDGAGAWLHAEARVQALGLQGRLGVAAVRPLVERFGHLIETETLGAAIRRTERAHASGG